VKQEINTFLIDQIPLRISFSPPVHTGGASFGAYR